MVVRGFIIPAFRQEGRGGGSGIQGHPSSSAQKILSRAWAAWEDPACLKPTNKKIPKPHNQKEFLFSSYVE